MPAYVPISQVMPTASMVSGAVVTSALCDQIDDNLAALYEGVWFRATRTASLAIGAATVTPVPLDTIVMSDTATDTACVSLASGVVQTLLTGHWWIGGNVAFTSTVATAIEMLIDSTDSAAYAAETYVDSSANKDNLAATAVVNVTTGVNVFTLNAYVVGGATIAASGPSSTLWGVYMGDI